MRIYALTLGLLGALALACAADPEQLAKEEAEADTKIVQLAAGLAKVAADHAAVPAGVVPCDDQRVGTLVRAQDAEENWVLTTTPERLAGFAGGVPRSGTAGDENDPWRFLEHGLLRSVQTPPHLPPDEDRVEKLRLARAIDNNPSIVVVLRPTLAEPIRVLSSAGADGSFDGGRWEGSAIVYDLRSGERLCSAPLRVEVSAEVSWTDRGVPGQSGEQALKADFIERFDVALDEALASISKLLTAHLV